MVDFRDLMGTTNESNSKTNMDKEKNDIPFDIHPQMERLVHIALSDGKITEKEKEIILRKAKTLGVDEDETEMILDALVSLRQQKNQNADLSEKEIENIFQEKRKESYVGEVKKCPNCGAEVKSFSAFCSSCGYELSGTKSSNAVKELLEGVKNFSYGYEEKKDAGYIAFVLYPLSFLMFGMAFSNEEGLTLLQKIMSFLGAIILVGVGTFLVTYVPTVKERDNFIVMFPVPNTKNDLLEMAILAKSQILPVNLFQYLFTRAGKKQQQLNQVWSKKLNQIVNKGRLSFANDPQTAEQFESILNTKL